MIVSNLAALVGVYSIDGVFICEGFLVDEDKKNFVIMPKSHLENCSDHIDLLSSDIRIISKLSPEDAHKQLGRAAFFDDNSFGYKVYDLKHHTYKVIEAVPLPRSVCHLDYYNYIKGFRSFHGNFEHNLPELKNVLIECIGDENIYMIWRGLKFICKYPNLKGDLKIGIYDFKSNGTDVLDLEIIKSFDDVIQEKYKIECEKLTQ